jgi:WD40 repeat protein
LTTVLSEDITRLWDLEGNLFAEYLGSTYFREDAYVGLCLGFTQDDCQIRTVTIDGTLHIWDIDAGLTVDGGLDDLLKRGCIILQRFRDREDVGRCVQSE